MPGWRLRLSVLAAAGICTPCTAQFAPTDQISRQVSNAVSAQAAQRIINPRLEVRGQIKATRLATSANGRYVAAAFDTGLVTVWDVERGREVVRFAGEPGTLRAIANDGRFIILSDGQALYRRDGSGRTRLADAPGVAAAALSHDDRQLAVADSAGKLRLVTLAGGASSAEASVGPLSAIAAGADGSFTLAAADGKLLRWDPKSAAATEIWARGKPFAAAAVAPADAVLFVLDKGGLERVDLASGKAKGLKKLPSPAVAAAVPAGARALVLALADGSLVVADAASGERLARLATTNAGWAVVDYSGRYDGNTSGIDAVSWQSEAKTLSLDALAEKYFEPGILSNVLSGRLASARRVPANVSEGVAMPPKVELKLGDGAMEAGRDFQVAVIVEDLGGGIDDIRLFHNGKLVDRGALLQTQDFTEGKRKFRALAFNVKPTGGVNTFRARAESLEGIESVSERASAEFKGGARTGKLIVVAIGVNEYGGRIPNLQLAATDALALDKQLSAAGRPFGGVARTLLVNDKADRAAVLRTLAEAGAAAQPEDTLLVYLAGHGVSVSDTEWLFLPSGSDPSSVDALRRTSVSAQELQQSLNAARANRIVLAIDACQAGAAFGAFASQRTAYLRLLSSLSRDNGIVVYAATQEGSDSYEINKLGHGIFTYSLLEGLRGKAGQADAAVTAFALADYVEKTVPALSQFYKDSRQDTATFRLGADFPITAR